MGLGRLELPTSRLSGVRSNHLSYRPLLGLLFLLLTASGSFFCGYHVFLYTLRHKNTSPSLSTTKVPAPNSLCCRINPYAKTYCTKVLLFFQRAEFFFSEKMRDFLIKQGRMHFLRGEVDSSRPWPEQKGVLTPHNQKSSHFLSKEWKEESYIYKGGDPAAGSPTATLLRLHPNHRPYRRRLPPLLVGSPASGKTDFRGVTGGVYKARERIHPSMLISNY